MFQRAQILRGTKGGRMGTSAHEDQLIELGGLEVRLRELEVVIYPQRTVEEWVGAGNYSDSVHRYVTNQHLSQFLTTEGVEAVKATIGVFCLGRSSGTDLVKAVQSDLGLRPGGFEHLGAIGEQHPNVQVELKKIVDPNNVFVSPARDHDVLMLVGFDDAYRSVWMGSVKAMWGEQDWFLGLRK